MNSHFAGLDGASWRHFSRRELEERIYGWGEEVESNAVEFPDSCPAQETGQRGYQERQGGRMDGLKRRVGDSLQIRLSLWLSFAILSVALIAGIFAFFSAFDEAHELQDDVLREVAMLFDRHA